MSRKYTPANHPTSAFRCGMLCCCLCMGCFSRQQCIQSQQCGARYHEAQSGLLPKDSSPPIKSSLLVAAAGKARCVWILAALGSPPHSAEITDCPHGCRIAHMCGHVPSET